MWITCKGNCLQLLDFWNFFVFFRFFPLKLVYFWTKSRKNIYGCFFHSFCATDLKFGTKNNGRMKQSILKTLIFASYWGFVPSLCYKYQKNILQHLIFCKNQACANCIGWNAATVIWLKTGSFILNIYIFAQEKWVVQKGLLSFVKNNLFP